MRRQQAGSDEPQAASAPPTAFGGSRGRSTGASALHVDESDYNDEEPLLIEASGAVHPVDWSKRVPPKDCCRGKRVGWAVCGLLLFYVYFWSLQVWGTFSPFFALVYTAPYTPPKLNSVDLAKRPRVVVSLTTLPHRVDHLPEILKDFARQTFQPDEVQLHIPHAKASRTGEEYKVPPEVANRTNVRVNRIEDFGPVTKLVGALMLEKDPSTIIITVDDDQLLQSDTFERLVTLSMQDPSAAWSPCGWGFLPMPEPLGVAPVYVPWFMRGEHGRSVQVLQACCGNTFRRHMFPMGGPELSKFANVSKECFTVDDVWIALDLARRGIPRVVAPGPRIDKWQPSFKARESGQWQLSSVNDENHVHYQCIKHMAPDLDHLWPPLD